MSYHVGQILFVILNKKVCIYPMMVIEEVIKKTMCGEDTSYVLQAGSDKSTIILLDQLDGEVFESAEEAKRILTNRATQQIEKLIDSAISKANEWYNNFDDKAPKVLTLPEDLNEVKITLSDGTIANLKTA